MANTFLTADIIAKQALATLTETLVMKPLIHTDLTKEFGRQKVGDTINVKKPATFEARDFDRARGIELQDYQEDSVAVKLDKFKDVSFAVTSEELALQIDDFDDQLLTPAMQALALGVDSAILALRDDIEQEVGTDDAFPFNKPEVLIDAGRVLDQNNVPVEGRRAVIGPSTKANWINTELLKRADQSGTTEALRKANLGKDLFGFDTYYTNNIKSPAPGGAPGTPTGEIGMAFHDSAFAFASAPQEVPPGAVGSVATHQGLSLRTIMQYDIMKKQTIVSLDILFGVKTLDPKRAVLLKGADN